MLLRDKRKWEVHTVDTDPSVFSPDKSYRRDPEVKWNPQEVNRSPIDYFYKAFPKSYIATILVNTNAKLAKISKIKPFNESDVTRMIGIRLALTLDSKKGGLDIHWADYDENIEGVILGGNFETRFGVSRSRFDKFWQAFRLTEYPESILLNTDHWYEVRGFYDAVNDNFDKSITRSIGWFVDGSITDTG